jgi:3-deoxy-D-manno-octulosonic-acid transferase
MSSSPLALRAYHGATSVLEPIVPLALARRARRGKEDSARLSERLGIASRPRPDGVLIWIHGASVGECLAALPLADAFLSEPNRSVLVTSGTVTSAALMAERLPPRALHQFVPVDTPSAVARFFDHWRPDVGLFVDSEIWPNMIVAAHARGVRLAIVNGRMSARSFSGWRRLRRTAAKLLSLYDVCLVQDRETATRLEALGAKSVEVAGNLKADSAPLPVDGEQLTALRRDIADRPIFLATNTHEGEDELLLAVHDSLRRHFPTLLTIIVPRHAERGTEIASRAGARALAQRSLKQPITDSVELYVADTMGELGLFYRLVSFAFIGKSLGAQGGQNPLEAARLGVAVLAGPDTENFRDAYETIFQAQGFGLVRSAEELTAAAEKFLTAPAWAREIGTIAQQAVLPLGGAVERTRAVVENMLRSYAHA